MPVQNLFTKARRTMAARMKQWGAVGLARDMTWKP
jgi:hypothetical protein